jgi:hypothetical protein
MSVGGRFCCRSRLKASDAASRYAEAAIKERHLQLEDLKIKRVQEAFSKARRGRDLFGLKDAG